MTNTERCDLFGEHYCTVSDENGMQNKSKKRQIYELPWAEELAG